MANVIGTYDHKITEYRTAELVTSAAVVLADRVMDNNYFPPSPERNIMLKFLYGAILWEMANSGIFSLIAARPQSQMLASKLTKTKKISDQVIKGIENMVDIPDSFGTRFFADFAATIQDTEKLAVTIHNHIYTVLEASNSSHKIKIVYFNIPTSVTVSSIQLFNILSIYRKLMCSIQFNIVNRNI